jgi:hypothetical protein
VREQLRRDTILRTSSVAHDQTARQAIATGQRRVMAVVLGAFSLLCLLIVGGFVFSRASEQPIPAPMAPMSSDAAVIDPLQQPPIPPMDNPALADPFRQRMEEELRSQAEREHQRAMEERGLVWDPQQQQYVPRDMQMPTPTLAPR